MPAPASTCLLLPWHGCSTTARTPVNNDQEEDGDLVAALAPSQGDALTDVGADPDHEHSRRKSRAHRKRAIDTSFKRHHSLRLAAMEPAVYVPVTEKASKAEAAKMELTGVSCSLVLDLEDSGVLARPPPSAISASKLKRIWHSCIPLSRLAALDAVVALHG